MNHIALSISQRMSLRKPQEDSLEILSKLCETLPLEKGADPAGSIQAVKSLLNGNAFEEFEHEFPSLCFALATGVGKTRLMGAFISYLFLAEGVKNFLVLAPNLTIYDKLKADFTPKTPKYVFQGISEFAINSPVLITGENYESGKGVASHDTGKLGVAHRIDAFATAYINVFNVSKINSEVRGGKEPRIKRLREYIGTSYFEYLSSLDDLVLIMDESHRYRADAGMRAINELDPILGLELTATPQVERGAKSIPFKNVAYNYPLSAAMQDGYVKEPAVATRENFDLKNFDRDSLERLKLEDGVRLHEATKAELEVYARQSRRNIVKPFMLIVAEDTAHADSLLQLIEGSDFFEGRYKGRAITVHSKQSGARQDEMIAQLLAVEDYRNPTEIVIHVNKLQEGWDVTNLYTIVPLRAANSKTLVEQSIGRGLRLPYGRRTGVEAVDTLTIVSHDKFQQIVEDARRPDSIIRRGIIIGEDIPAEGLRAVTIEPVFVPPSMESQADDQPSDKKADRGKKAEADIQREFLKVLKNFESLPTSSEMLKPEVSAKIVQKVTDNLAPKQAAISDFDPLKNVQSVIQNTTKAYLAYAIDIPRIVVVPKGEVTAGFRDFELEHPKSRFQPVDEKILIQSLENDNRRYLDADTLSEQRKLEDYLVSGLMDYDDVNYDEHSNLLYKLAGQMVEYLRTYLQDDEKVKNVLLYYNKTLVELIHSQMEANYEETASGFEAKVSKGFIALSECNFTTPVGQEPREFRQPVDDKVNIRKYLFTGFAKCIFPTLKFDSDAERMLVCVLEKDDEVRRWLRPSAKLFQIDYRHGEGYEPDFVVETESERYLIEVKRRNALEEPDVVAKRDAAVTWCSHATTATGTMWTYAIVPHDAIQENASFGGLLRKYSVALSEVGAS